MYELVREGKAVIKIRKADKISREMEVFYNPVMKLNRDITILLLKQFPSMNLCDPLAASGIRSIRFAKELRYKSITANDISKGAVNSIKDNLKLNKINNFTVISKSNNDKTINKINNNPINNKRDNKIIINNGDANLFLLNSSGFDYIDIDPFGSSNLYLESAIKRISRNGILAVTNTDTAALTGTYPKACIRKYWSMPKRDYMMHETGLRILIRKIQLIGMQYEKALFPVFSYSKDHYFRVFFQCVKGKKLCDDVAAKHGMFNDAGPLWLGDLWDGKLVNRMYATLIKTPIESIPLKINSLKISKNFFSTSENKEIIKDNQNNNELLKFLKIIKDESKINTIGFYDIHTIAKKRKLKTMTRKDDIIKKIKKKGFKSSNTHFCGTGVRSNIPYTKLLRLLKE
jgi:tRNA (guanine26-N2/guanine27-N2)-dimethyltransferase